MGLDLEEGGGEQLHLTYMLPWSICRSILFSGNARWEWVLR